LGITKQSFFFQKDSILKNLPRGFDNKIYTRFTISIDAASVAPFVCLHPDRKVDGFLDLDEVSPEIFQKIQNDKKVFHQFCFEHRKMLISHSFILYTNSAEQSKKAFLIAVFESNKGSPDAFLISAIRNTYFFLKQIGLNVIGFCGDGDRGYSTFMNSTVKLITNINAYNFDLKFTENFHQDPMSVIFFSDVLHLLKVIRYRFVEADLIWIFPGMEKGFTKNDLLKLGMPQCLLNDCRTKKMEDGFPLRMFSIKYVRKAMQLKRLDLMFALIQWTFLRYAFLHQSLSRSQRVELLLLSFCCVVIYYISLKDYFHRKKHSSPEARKQHFPQKMNLGKEKMITVIDKENCKKALTLIYNSIFELSKNQNIYLGALTSHPPEHFFGLIRRINKGNDRYQNFLSANLNSVLIKEIKKNYNFEIKIKSRTSNSGATISKDDIEHSENFGIYFSIVSAFLRHVIDYDSVPKQLSTIMDQSVAQYFMHYNRQPLIELIIDSIDDRELEKITSSNQLLNKTGGLTNDRRMAAKSCFNDVAEIDDEDVLEVDSFATETTESILFADKAILYVFDDGAGEWKERAYGTVGILQHLLTGHCRIFMPQKGTWFTRLNFFIYDWMNLIPKAENAVMFRVFEPNIETMNNVNIYALQIANPEKVQQFEEIFNEQKNKS
jgi:hypothetical protein